MVKKTTFKSTLTITLEGLHIIYPFLYNVINKVVLYFQDWSDLIEYVIHKFINTPGTHVAEATVDNHQENFEEFYENLSDNGRSE